MSVDKVLNLFRIKDCLCYALILFFCSAVEAAISGPKKSDFIILGVTPAEVNLNRPNAAKILTDHYRSSRGASPNKNLFDQAYLRFREVPAYRIELIQQMETVSLAQLIEDNSANHQPKRSPIKLYNEFIDRNIGILDQDWFTRAPFRAAYTRHLEKHYLLYSGLNKGSTPLRQIIETGIPLEGKFQGVYWQKMIDQSPGASKKEILQLFRDGRPEVGLERALSFELSHDLSHFSSKWPSTASKVIAIANPKLEYSAKTLKIISLLSSAPNVSEENLVRLNSIRRKTNQVLAAGLKPEEKSLSANYFLSKNLQTDVALPEESFRTEGCPTPLKILRDLFHGMGEN